MIKCLSLSVAFVFFISTLSTAQPLWQRTNGPSGAGISEIAFDSSGGAFVIANAAFRTVDGGATWHELAITPTDIHTLHNGHIVAILNGQIAISTDVGATWSSVLAQTGPIAITLTGEIFVATQSAVYRSTNEGISWDTLAAPPTTARFYCFYTSTLFLLTSDRGGGSLYRSTNNGSNWSRVVNGLSLDNFYGDDIAGNPAGAMVYACRDGRYLSTDDGRTWKSFSSNNDVGIKVAVDHSGHFAIGTGGIEYFDSLPGPSKNYYGDDGRSISSFNGSQVLVGAPDGGFWSAGGSNIGVVNAALTSTHIVGPPTGQITSMAPLASGSILANSNGTLYRTTNAGDTWASITGDIKLLAFDSAHDILAAYGGAIKRTSDGGNNWSQLGYTLTSTGITSAIVDPTGMIYVGSGEGVFRSSDNGATWDQLNAGLGNLQVASLAVNAKGDVFAGTSTRIYESTDHALTWSALAFAPSTDTVLYDSITRSVSHGFSALTFNTAGDLIAVVPNLGVFWSHDNGATWDSIGTGLSGEVKALLSTPSGHVFAGTDHGVFYLAAGGATWVDANSGLDGVPVLSITRDAAGTVYLGTNGKGVYRSTLTYNRAAPPNAVNSSTAETGDIKVYPNPMSARGQIEFNRMGGSNIRITILNSLGEEVAAMTPLASQTGSITFSFDASTLASGVYTVRISDGLSYSTRHFLVSR